MSVRPKKKSIAEANVKLAPLSRVALHVDPSDATAAVSPTTIPDFDKVIHERARLAIVSALATGPQTHNSLRELLALTDGNLSVHARRLEEVGYIACEKDFAGRMPRTTYKLTAAGKQAFERYLSHMEALIQAMRGR